MIVKDCCRRAINNIPHFLIDFYFCSLDNNSIPLESIIWLDEMKRIPTEQKENWKERKRISFDMNLATAHDNSNSILWSKKIYLQVKKHKNLVLKTFGNAFKILFQNLCRQLKGEDGKRSYLELTFKPHHFTMIYSHRFYGFGRLTVPPMYENGPVSHSKYFN